MGRMARPRSVIVGPDEADDNVSRSAIELRRLSVTYGSFAALSDLTLVIPEGEIHAVIGPNGAGKSTMFGAITGDITPSSGRVLIRGQDVTGIGSTRVSRAGLATMFQRSTIFPKHTVRESVRVSAIGRSGGLHKKAWRSSAVEDEVDRALRLTHLEGRAGTIAGTLSHGDQRLLEFAMCLASRPAILLLDEPTAGMSADETRTTVELVRTLNAQVDLTILISEHDMDVIFGLASRISVVVAGQLILTGSPDEVSQSSEVREVYF